MKGQASREGKPPDGGGGKDAAAAPRRDYTGMAPRAKFKGADHNKSSHGTGKGPPARPGKNSQTVGQTPPSTGHTSPDLVPTPPGEGGQMSGTSSALPSAAGSPLSLSPPTGSPFFFCVSGAAR